MADTERVLNSVVTTSLAIVQRDEAGDSVAVDADESPTAEIRKLGVVVFTIANTDITHSGTGAYSFDWTPVVVGTYVVTWFFLVGGEEYESEETISVSAEVEGTSDSALSAEDDESVPDLGTSKTCLVTGAFYDAAGNGMKGVFVRFTPDRATTVFLSSGIVAAETTSSSDEDGAFSMYLVRGVTGTLAITGVGIVRRITVPDVGAISIAALADLGDDPLEVQRPAFYALPRRS